MHTFAQWIGLLEEYRKGETLYLAQLGLIFLYVCAPVCALNRFFTLLQWKRQRNVCIVNIPVCSVQVVGGAWLFSRLYCNIFVTLDVMMCTASILNLCAISIDRWVCSVSLCAPSLPLELLCARTGAATSSPIQMSCHVRPRLIPQLLSFCSPCTLWKSPNFPEELFSHFTHQCVSISGSRWEEERSGGFVYSVCVLLCRLSVATPLVHLHLISVHLFVSVRDELFEPLL